MPVNRSQLARTSPSRSSGERIPFSGGDGGGVGYMIEKFRSLSEMKRKANLPNSLEANVSKVLLFPS